MSDSKRCVEITTVSAHLFCLPDAVFRQLFSDKVSVYFFSEVFL